MEKIRVGKELYTFIYYEMFDFSGCSLNGIIDKCNQIKNQYPEYEEIIYEYIAYDGSVSLSFVGWREETDQEFANRKKQIEAFEKEVKRQQDIREQKERELYQQLKAKYETN